MEKVKYKADEDSLSHLSIEDKQRYQAYFENTLKYKLERLADSLNAFGQTSFEQMKAIEEMATKAFNDIIKK